MGHPAERRKRRRKRRKNVTLERKSPPFAEKREGWGTLKYIGPRA
jgi:hypothetical protein